MQPARVDFSPVNLKQLCAERTFTTSLAASPSR